MSRELKLKAKALADRELLTEAAWLKGVILREVRAKEAGAAGDACLQLGARSRSRGGTRRVYVRLCTEDWLLLEARAMARGVRPGTYVSVLTRSHLRSLAPLPKEELLALKASIAELAAVGRNINQIARVANQGTPVAGPHRDDLMAILTVCVALRDHVKALLRANLKSWDFGVDDTA